MYQRVNLEYVIAKRKEISQLKRIMNELQRLMNGYCTVVTGIDKNHILLEEVYKMFPNIEIIDFTIEYALSCLEGLTEEEKYYIVNIIIELDKLKRLKLEEIPF
jgi:hypothetical protein